MAGKKPEQRGSVIGPGIRVTGDLKTQETLRILGILDGNLMVDGAVEVGQGGRVRGDVSAREVSVEGRIDGEPVKRTAIWTWKVKDGKATEVKVADVGPAA